jgi:hypothetical protein
MQQKGYSLSRCTKTDSYTYDFVRLNSYINMGDKIVTYHFKSIPLPIVIKNLI